MDTILNTEAVERALANLVLARQNLTDYLALCKAGLRAADHNDYLHELTIEIDEAELSLEMARGGIIRNLENMGGSVAT